MFPCGTFEVVPFTGLSPEHRKWRAISISSAENHARKAKNDSIRKFSTPSGDIHLAEAKNDSIEKFSAPSGDNQADDSVLVTTENVYSESEISAQIRMSADTWSDTTSPLKSHSSSPIGMMVSPAHSEEEVMEFMVVSPVQAEQEMEVVEIPLPQSDEVVWVPPPQVEVKSVMYVKNRTGKRSPKWNWRCPLEQFPTFPTDVL
ncbi:hypothetical protein CAEBREN_25495 [Caenorhabditis brenneri]|uniref:Uncharacterized protein n=1 Tax=Caenorhabditis brenneri TaxID=135651 RepID=G0MGC8_CAEBE|nr:hypothetical protein CAEBREN_25495 [Caenorhabditis brenneri]